MTIQNKRLTSILLSIPLLLLIPFIAMQYSAEVSWTLGDFIVAGGLLLVTGLLAEWVLRTVTSRSHRIILCLLILAGLLLFWAELAVGIFGTPFGGS